MASIPTDQLGMRLAFNRHYAAAHVIQSPHRSRLLLLFYAAETGLKAVYMREKSLNDSNDLFSHLKTFYNTRDGHDLHRLIDGANISSADVAGAPGSFNINYNGSVLSINECKIHEAARYGNKICPNYLTQIELWLETICQVVRDRLSGVS